MSTVRSLVGSRIKAARLSRGWKQGALAEMVGCDVNTISRYETGKVSPDIEQLMRLAEVLEVSPLELLPPVGGEAQRLIDLRKNLTLKARQVHSAAFLERILSMMDGEIARQRKSEP